MWERTKIGNSGPISSRLALSHQQFAFTVGCALPAQTSATSPSHQLPALPMYFVNWEVRVGGGDSQPTPWSGLLVLTSHMVTSSGRQSNTVSKASPDYVDISACNAIVGVYIYPVIGIGIGTDWHSSVYSYTALAGCWWRRDPSWRWWWWWPGHYITLWCHPNPTVQSSQEQRHEDCAYLFW